MTRSPAHRRIVWAAAVAVFLVAASGCSKQTQPKPLESRPAQAPATLSPTAKGPASAPVPGPLPMTTQPASTQPAETQPASTYDSKPPYPVRLYVRRPEDTQPGWLKILKLDDDAQVATAAGTFPEKNRIYVDTHNVQQIRIHIGQLPLAERKRIVLQIDEQGIEIARKRRQFVTMERTPAGVWEVIKPKRR